MGYPDNIFLISLQKHVVGAHYKHLSKVLLMSIHNMFYAEIRKIPILKRDALSGVMIIGCQPGPITIFT